VGLLRSKGRVETAKDRVRPYAAASSKVVPMASQVRDHLAPAVGTARDKVSPYAEKAVERGAAVAQSAVEKAQPVIDDALSKVGPATEHAAEKARERLNDDLVPKLTAALAALAAAAEPVVEETTRRGRATKAALKGELDLPKKGHKFRNFVFFLGFGALAAAAVRKLLTPPEPAWQSTPSSGRDYSSAPAGTTSRPAADKPAGTATDTPPKPETKEETATSNGKTEAEEAKPEAKEEVKPEVKEEDDTTKTASNSTAKKATTTQRRTTGSNNSKPTDS